MYDNGSADKTSYFICNWGLLKRSIRHDWVNFAANSINSHIILPHTLGMTQIKRDLTKSFEVHCLHTLANLQHIDKLKTKIIVNKKPILNQTFWAWLTKAQIDKGTLFAAIQISANFCYNTNFCKFLLQSRFLQYKLLLPISAAIQISAIFMLQYKFLLQIKYAHKSHSAKFKNHSQVTN